MIELKPRSDLVLVDADDDLASIRAKLENCQSPELLVVIPSRVAALRTPLEFRILARLAHELASALCIITPDSHRRKLAGQEGFKTYRSVKPFRQQIGQIRPSAISRLEWLGLPSTGTLLLGVMGIAALAAANIYVLPVMQVQVAPQIHW